MSEFEIQFKRQKLAGLECIVGGDLGPSRPTVILLHGYGANEEDFLPIVQYLQSAKDYSWIFPRAPIALEMPYSFMNSGSFAWYPIRLSELEAAQRDSSVKPLSLPTLEGFHSAREMILNLVKEAGLDFSKVFFCGFSQGSTIAADLVFRAKENPLGLGIFSGSYVGDAGWDEMMSKHSGLHVLQTHGRADPVLSFRLAEDLHKMIEKNGGDIHFVPFSGGHEFPIDAMRAFDQTLTKILVKS